MRMHRGWYPHPHPLAAPAGLVAYYQLKPVTLGSNRTANVEVTTLVLAPRETVVEVSIGHNGRCVPQRAPEHTAPRVLARFAPCFPCTRPGLPRAHLFCLPVLTIAACGTSPGASQV